MLFIIYCKENIAKTEGTFVFMFRYHGRNFKEYDSQYYEAQSRNRGRTRGYPRGGRGGDSNYYSNSPARYQLPILACAILVL